MKNRIAITFAIVLSLALLVGSLIMYENQSQSLYFIGYFVYLACLVMVLTRKFLSILLVLPAIAILVLAL